MAKGQDTSDAVLASITAHIEANGWAPTMREIAADTGRSTNSCFLAVKRLSQQGLIETGGGPRQIRLARMKAATEEMA